MLNVSQQWKDLQKKGFIDKLALLEIEFRVVDSSQYDTTVIAPYAASFSTPHDIIGQDYTRVVYATLERNFWVLDGSREILPDLLQKPNTGYIGAEIDSDTNRITITDYDGFNTISQCSIEFDKYNCVRNGTIGFYDASDKLIYEKTFENNHETTLTLSFEKDITGYHKVVIESKDVALPNQRVRIKSFTAGVIKIFTNKDIISYSAKNNVSLINDKLPTNDINFELDNTDNKFNPDNRNGLFNYLSKRQEIKIRYGYAFDDGDEYISGGTYYLTEWETPQNSHTATFKAKNAINFFTKPFYKGLNKSKTLAELAKEVLALCNWDDDYVFLDPILNTITTDAPMPACSCAEALQYIAQAANCMLYIDSNNVITIERISLLANDDDYEINNFNEYEYPELEIDDEIHYINIGVYSYFNDDEIKELYKGNLSLGTQEIIYSDRADYSSINITGAIIDYDETSSFKTVCEVETEGEVVVSGYVLKESASIYTIDNEKNGDDLQIENPLITSKELAADVGDYITEWINKRYTDSCNFRIDPRLELLDRVNIQGKLFVKHLCIIKEIGITFKGAFKGTCKGKRLD